VAVVPFVGIVVVVVLTVDVDVELVPELAGVDVVVVVVVVVIVVEVCTASVVGLLLAVLEVVEASDEVVAGSFDSESCEDVEDVAGFMGVGAPDEVVSGVSGCGGGAESAFEVAATPLADVVTASSGWLGAVVMSSDFGSCAS
jgi:hypothetical protein